MDKYREGIKLYFKVAKTLSPLDFNSFTKSWFSPHTDFSGYNQSIFNLYLELSNQDNDSELFIFSQTEGVEKYNLNRLEKKISKINLVTENMMSLNYSGFYSKHKPVFMKTFNLSQRDNYILSERITLALCDMGLYDNSNLEYAGVDSPELLLPEVLDLGEGVMLNFE